ncbi:MAG: hypothetical protein GVY30_11665 [Chloroflexi bacterium]|jgi:hypothetical protein|nr:hypothetical protein [Chloroflexota bacterium]
MLDLHLDVQPQTARRLQRILELHPDQETFAQDIIAYQIKEFNKAILNLQLELKAYEQAYQRSSADFYAEFSQGHLDDREAYMLWAGLYEMLKENQRRLESLR